MAAKLNFCNLSKSFSQILSHTMYICVPHAADLLNTNNMREVLDSFWNHRARWRLIGIEIGIDVGTLDAIAKKHNDPEDHIVELIGQWLRGSSPRPTRSTMTTALQSQRVTGGATSVQGA